MLPKFSFDRGLVLSMDSLVAARLQMTMSLAFHMVYAAIGIGMPIRFSATPVRLDQPAMALGGANEEIYGGMLGMSQEELASLRAARWWL